MANPNKSRLFVNYNAARRLAREGKLDMERVNKALGIAQSKTSRPYNTSWYQCDCPDAMVREITCKHQIAAAIKEA